MTAADRADSDDGGALYGLEPSEFTAARNELSKRLKAAGDKEGAARVARLRKPPVTAWALNAVARRLPGVIDAVLDAGAGLRAATENALAGDAAGLRTAQAWERRAVDAAVTTAAEVLADAGHGSTDAARQRMAGTLRAAMVDPEVADALRRGVLDDDREAPGFGLDAFSAAAAGSAATRRERPRPPATPPAPTSATGPDPDEASLAERQRVAEEAAEQAALAKRKAKRLASEADTAQAAAEKAQATAVKARVAVDDAAARAAVLEKAAEEARSTAAAARAAAEEAAAAAAALQA